MVFSNSDGTLRGEGEKERGKEGRGGGGKEGRGKEERESTNDCSFGESLLRRRM